MHKIKYCLICTWYKTKTTDTQAVFLKLQLHFVIYLGFRSNSKYCCSFYQVFLFLFLFVFLFVFLIVLSVTRAPIRCI